MDIIKIQCPQCGAPVERKSGEYFGVCPYCRCEIGFDEIKEETEVVKLRSRVNDLSQQLNSETKYKSDMVKWTKARNFILFAMAGLIFLSFIMLSSTDDTDSVWIGAGSVGFIFACMIYVIGNSLIAALYPCSREQSADSVKIRLKTWLMLMLLGGAVGLAAMILAYPVSEALF